MWSCYIRSGRDLATIFECSKDILCRTQLASINIRKKNFPVDFYKYVPSPSYAYDACPENPHLWVFWGKRGGKKVICIKISWLIQNTPKAIRETWSNDWTSPNSKTILNLKVMNPALESVRKNKSIKKKMQFTGKNIRINQNS